MKNIDFNEVPLIKFIDKIHKDLNTPLISFKKLLSTVEPSNLKKDHLNDVWVQDSCSFSHDNSESSYQCFYDFSDENSNSDTYSSSISQSIQIPNPFIENGFSFQGLYTFIQNSLVKLSSFQNINKCYFSFNHPPLGIEFVSNINQGNSINIFIHFMDKILLAEFLAGINEFKRLLKLKFKQEIEIEEVPDDFPLPKGVIKSYKFFLSC